MSFNSSSPSVDSSDGKSMSSPARKRQARHECPSNLEMPTLDSLTFHEQPEGRDTMRRQGKSTYSVGNGTGNPILKHGSTRHTQEPPGSASSNTVKDSDVEMTAPTDERCKQRQQNPVANDKAARSKEPNNSAVSSNDNGQANKANLDQVSKRMEELQTQLKQTKADATKYEGLARDYKERLEHAQRQCVELTEANRQLNNDALEKIQRANENTRSAQERARSVMADADRYRNETDKYIQSLMLEHSKQTADRDAQVRQLLDKVTRDKVEGKWNPPPDDEIRHKFNLLNNDIRDWSKAWASKDLKLNHMMNRDFANFLSAFVAIQASGGVPQYLYQPSQKWREKLGPLLLHAALSHEIHKEFFGNPFWLVDKDQAVFTNVFERLKASNAKEAHIWRASLWRLLNPPSHIPLSKSAASVAEETRKRTTAFCESLDRRFRESPAADLFAHTDSTKQKQERAIKLRKIMSTAAEVSTILWTQHSYLSILNLQYLQERNIRFHIASRFLEGHPLSKVDVDDDSHNGEGIIVVTRPALLAFDEDDMTGIDGDQFRVLEKATVLLEGKK